MVIYQFRNIHNKSFNLVECTVQAMFGCRIGEIILRTSQGGDNYD